MKGIVYTITLRATGETYVGATTTTAKNRMRGHIARANLPRPNGVSPFLSLLAKHGWKAFDIREETCVESLDALRDAERRLIAQLRAEGRCLNVFDGGDVLDEDARAKIGAKSSKRTASDETRAKMRNAKLGTKASEETRAKMRESHLGKPATAGFTGRQHSDETRAKMRASMKGLKRSEEGRANMRRAAQTRKSPGTKGRPKSEIARANMRAAWARRKAARQQEINHADA